MKAYNGMKSCCLVLSKCSLYQYFIFFLLLSLFKNGASVTVPPSLPPGEDWALLGASAGAPCAAWRNDRRPGSALAQLRRGSSVWLTYEGTLFCAVTNFHSIYKH